MTGDIERPTAWRWRGPRGGWIYSEDKPKYAAEPVYAAAEISALRAELAEVEEERDKFRELFGECQLARDTAGFVGSVPQCIEFFEAAATTAEAARTAAEAEVARLKEALEEAEDTLRLVEHPAFPDPLYHEQVKALGNRIGFGALMATASAAWREVLIAQGMKGGGEFVAGPCHSTVVGTLAVIRAALTKGRADD